MNIRTCTERETILLVNPSEDDRAELVHILEDDCSILEAASTAEASLILSAPSFSCAAVILDLALPDDGTFELLKLLKQNGAVQSMPVLIASFSRDEDMEEKALKLGAEDFILKPYHAGSVRHRIEGLVSACTAERTKWHSASDEMQKMVDDIPGGIVKFRLAETHIEPVYISESLCRTIGDTREHLMERFQKDYLDGIHPDDRKNTAVLTEEAFRDRKPFNVCYRMQNTHGSCRWLNVRSSMHPDRDGNYDCYAVYSDVTEEMETRQAEEQTAREKELLKDSLPGAVFKYRNNPDWVLTYANDEFFCFFGYTRTEFGDLFGMRLINVLYPGDRDLILSGIISQLEQKDTVYSEIRAVCKNGVIKWVSIYAQHARNEIGKEYFCCTFVDITEKIQAEQKLKNTQTELSTLIHNMPGGVFKYDSITGEFEFISPYMLSMLGYSREEFAKKFNNSFTNMVYIEDRQRVLDEISEQIAVGDTDYCEYRVETGSGELKWVYDAGFLLKQGSKAVFYVVIVDITDRKKAELEIARLQGKMVLAIDHAGLGYWDYDIKNKTAYLNQILTDQYNIPQVLDPYPQEAFDSGTIVKDSYAEYQRLVDAVDRGEPFVIGDIQTINTNGEYKWKRIHFTTLFDEGGKPYWAFATAVTIDDYKLLEQQFSIAAEQTGVDVWIFYIQTRTLTKTALSGKDSNSNKVFENAPFSLIEQGIVHPDDAQEIIDIYRRMADGKSRASGIFRFLDSHTGEYVHFKTDYTLLLDKNGKPDRVICTSIDITEQVHLEQQYQEAMELYQGSSGDNAMLSGYCSITRNKLLGISAHNHTDYMSKYGDDADAFFIGLSKMVSEKNEQEIIETFLSAPLAKAYAKGITEHSICCKVFVEGGSVRYADMTIKVLKNPTSDELAGFFTITDVTEEMVRQKAVRTSFEKYCDLIIDVNISTDHYRVLSNSERLKTVIPEQGNFKEMSQRIADKLADEDSRKEFLKKTSVSYMKDHLEYEESYLFYFRMCIENILRSKKLQIFYIDKELEHVGIIGIDITATLAEEQRKNEVLSLALISSEHANKAKSEFLSRMSHDIRTPMNAIIGMTELSKEEIDDKERIKKNLDVIDISSRLLLSIINDVLDMSQIESGRMVLVQEPFDSIAEANKIVEMANVMFEIKHQKFTVQKSLKTRYFIGDAVRIKRVIMNLLNNASKFTPDKGTVALTISEEPHSNPQFATIVFSVKDSGIGIPKEKISTIFIPFEQLETDAKNEGTGLGLPIVKSIVESQGGVISVESEVGKGSVFTAKIPLRIANAMDNLTPIIDTDRSADQTVFSGLHVLLVEDHPINTAVAKRMLEKHGAHVDTAENGAIGYDKLLQSPAGTYDIIFMDIQMPVMNGYEAAKAIRESSHPQSKTIPIIAITANAFTEDIQISLDSGMNGHIAKPIRFDAIEKTVFKIMNGMQKKTAD